MIVRLLLALLITVFVVALARLLWLQVSPPSGSPAPQAGGSAARRPLLGGTLVVLAALLLILVITGRAHWLLAIPAALLTLARGALGLAPLLGWLRGRGTPASGGSGAAGQGNSRVRSRFLAMQLDLDSGELDGDILEGTHAGERLSALALDSLLDLLDTYRQADPDSARLLETFLDRQHDGARRAGDESASDTGDAPAGGALSRSEALEILGLAPDADTDAVRKAHRRLMQKCHPDHGGSAYLAARLNAARDRLLDDEA